MLFTKQLWISLAFLISCNSCNAPPKRKPSLPNIDPKNLVPNTEDPTMKSTKKPSWRDIKSAFGGAKTPEEAREEFFAILKEYCPQFKTQTLTNLNNGFYDFDIHEQYKDLDDIDDFILLANMEKILDPKTNQQEYGAALEKALSYLKHDSTFKDMLSTPTKKLLEKDELHLEKKALPTSPKTHRSSPKRTGSPRHRSRSKSPTKR